MSEIRPPRRGLTARLGLPGGFFNFDMKDTFRLVVWIVMAAFALGGLWAKNSTDLAELRGADSVVAERIAREEMARKELAKQVEQMAENVARRAAIDAAQVQALEGIHTELRYVNEKIDVLRDEVRGARTVSPPRRPE